MKTLRQVVLFVLGITAGICAYSLLKYVPAPSAVMASSKVDGSQSLSAQPQPGRVAAHVASYGRLSRHSGRHKHHFHHRHHEMPSATIAQAAPTPAAPIPQVAPIPTYFKADGYVEKADGQLEAIIIQNDGIQILKLGDRIGDHLRVTSITRESVGAIDEAAYHVPSTQPSNLDKPGSTDLPDITVAYSPGLSTPQPISASGSRGQVLLALGSIR